MRSVRFVIPVPILALSATLSAQEPTLPVTETVRVVRAPDAQRRPFLIEAGDYSVWEIVQDAAEHLRRSYVPGDEQVERQGASVVSIRFPLHLDQKQLDRFVGRILAHGQLAASPLHVDGETGVYQVLSTVGSRRSEVLEQARFVLPDDVLQDRAGSDFVMTMVPIQNANAQQLGNEMRMFASVGGNNTAMVTGSMAANAILLIGPAFRVAELVEMARQLDAVAAPSDNGVERQLRALTARITALEEQLTANREAGTGKKGD